MPQMRKSAKLLGRNPVSLVATFELDAAKANALMKLGEGANANVQLEDAINKAIDAYLNPDETEELRTADLTRSDQQRRKRNGFKILAFLAALLVLGLYQLWQIIVGLLG